MLEFPSAFTRVGCGRQDLGPKVGRPGFLEVRELRVQEHGGAEPHEPRVAFVQVEEVATAPDVDIETGDQRLPHRVDRRVGDLGEPLGEVVIEQLGTSGKHGQRRVVAHGANGLLAVVRHRYEDVVQLVRGIAEGDLTLLEGRPILPDGRHGLIAGAGPVQADHVFPDPLNVGPLSGDQGFGIVVAEQNPRARVDNNHLTGAQSSLLDHAAVGHVEHAHLGSHDDHVIVGELVACGTQPVAVEDRADIVAVAEGDGSGTVPGLAQTVVELVESAEVG